MIANLKETTERNQEQDWLKTNLAKFSRMMQGQKDLESVSRLIMRELTPLVSRAPRRVLHHGQRGRRADAAAHRELRVSRAEARGQPVRASAKDSWGRPRWRSSRSCSRTCRTTTSRSRPVWARRRRATSSCCPILFEGEVKAVIELASFLPFSQIHQTFLDQLAESIGVVLNMIGASMRTEELLEQSQKLTQELQTQSKELQSQQDELKRSNSELEAQAKTLRQSEELLKEQQEELQQVNEELEEKASLLAEQNQKVEQKNREVEAARLSLEEKAEQLAHQRASTRASSWRT